MNTKNILKDAFKGYIESGSFFERWFKQHSTPYYFTFKLNLSRTNIQYGELKSLLKSNIYDNERNKSYGKRIQIHTVKMLNDSIEKMISAISFPVNDYRLCIKQDPSSTKYNHKLEKTLNSLIANYYELLSSTIVIDVLFGSCCLFIPPNLKVDIINIMAQSGYLNTCGELIYIRNFNKANKIVFFNNLSRSLNSNSGKSIFNVFSYEDFSYTISQKHNYENLKIHIDKFYFDSKPLSKMLFELRNNFKDKLDVILSFDNSKKGNSINSYWLVKDTSISDKVKIPGEENYFICYKQLLKNDVQTQIFNENKPAWKSNTNIPHTLIGAMINLAFEDFYLKENKIVIIDPFAGTGTTILELIKLKKKYDIEICGSDIEDSFPVLLEDNKNILGMKKEELKKLIAKLEDKDWQNDYHKLLENIEELNLSRENEELEIPKNKIERFKNLSLVERIFIYTYFIVRINYTNKIERTNTFFRNTYYKEIEKLIQGLKELKEVAELDISSNEFEPLDSNFKIVKGRFSNKIILNTDIFLNFKLNEEKIIGGFDFKNLQSDYYDLILGDPPYGFNANHDVHQLLKLYSDMAKVFVKSIKNGGQIILSLPDRSYSGKHSPWFTHKEMVLTRFNYEAYKQNKSMISYTEINPSKEIFNPPYYWEAQKALRRSIIHMKFL